jgi:transcriptional regulator with XRE-family HTH domain
MANDKNLRAGTDLFPLEVLQHQIGWPQSLLAELSGVSISHMSRVFAGTRTLSVEAVAKLRRFFTPGMKKNQKLYLTNPHNLPFKSEFARHYLQSLLLQLRAEQAEVELKLDAMKTQVQRRLRKRFSHGQSVALYKSQ